MSRAQQRGFARRFRKIGSEAGNLAVDATNLNAEFKANFTTTTEEKQQPLWWEVLHPGRPIPSASGLWYRGFKLLTVSVDWRPRDDVLFI